MTLDHGQRFANLGSKLSSDLTERVEDVFLPGRRDLLLIQNASRTAVLDAQPQHKLAPNPADGAFQNGGAAGSLADLLRDFRSQLRIFLLAHQGQRLLYPRVRKQTEERRLLKLYRQPLTQRVVKDRIARLVLEVRENDSVLLGQFGSRRGMRKRPCGHSAQEKEYDSRGCTEDGHPVPAQKLSRLVEAVRR